jgi:hypothetical protein
MPLNEYAVGTAVRIPIQLREDRVPIDPATITVKLVAPDTTSTTYTLAGGQVIRDSAGLYHLDVTVSTQPGEWTYSVRTTSPDHTTLDRTFTVVTSVFG